MTNYATTKDIVIEHPSPAEAALAFVMEYGAMLDSKEEWDLEDNFDTTEMLYDLYQRLTGQR